MIAQEFPDSISGVVQKITTLTQNLGKEVRVFNTSSQFAELGIVFEHPTKGSNLILVQALKVGEGVQLTCSPWYKSWKGSRIVVPNLAKDEAMDFIRVQFIPALHELYPQSKPEIHGEGDRINLLSEIFKWLRKQFVSLGDNLGIVGVWILFLILVFYLPQQKKENTITSSNAPDQEISSCFCQQALGEVSDVMATEAQVSACTLKYICTENAKASCLLQAEREWVTCEF
jgi:hypothetical protein